MSVTRIGEFRAKEFQDEALYGFLQSIIPLIEASEGCNSCLLLRNAEDARKFVIIEFWDSIEEHKASVKNIPPEMFQNALNLLANPPTGAYYLA